MNEIVTQIREAWIAASKHIHEQSKDSVQHFPTLSPEQLDEVIETFCKWAERQAAPRGFKPVNSIARTLLTTESIKVLEAIKNFNDSEDWTLPFLDPIARAFSFLSLSAIFSDKDGSRNLIAEQGGKLAESLALMDTAQSELGKKMEHLNAADAIIERLSQHEAGIAEKEKAAQDQCSAIEEAKTSAEGHVEEIQRVKSDSDALKTQTAEIAEAAKKLQEENTAFHRKLIQQSEELDSLKLKAVEQSKLISELLPNATNAGLAASYGDRARSIVNTMRFWRWLFIGSVAALTLGSAVLLGFTLSQEADIWRYFLLRLPVVAPVVWLAWFSAIQYGNAMRLEEHYSFKEATSKAFAGYREHMQHLGAAKDDGDGEPQGQDIMMSLASKTIEILGAAPANSFGRAEKEASPSAEALEALLKRLTGDKSSK